MNMAVTFLFIFFNLNKEDNFLEHGGFISEVNVVIWIRNSDVCSGNRKVIRSK